MIDRREKKKSRENESERARKRYAEDPEYRARKLAANRAYQGKNREQIAARQRESIASRREKDRKRYAEDADYRARTLAKNLAYYRSRREELIARRRERWWSDPEFRARQVARFRERRHVLMYGLTAEDYQRLLAAQNGACAVCRQISERRLCVDHCHATGEVRGLLCSNCNTAIGLLDDDPERMRAAALYVLRARRVAQVRVGCRPDILMIGASGPMPMPGVRACVGLRAQVGRFGFAGRAVAS